MTKKNIIAIAETIKGLSTYKDMDDCLVVDVDEVIEAFSNLLSRENPRFNEKLFRDFIAGKCGPNGGAVK